MGTAAKYLKIFVILTLEPVAHALNLTLNSKGGTGKRVKQNILLPTAN